MVETSNQFILTIIFLVLFLALGGGLWYMKRKYPEETLGEIISIIFQREIWTIQIATMFIIGLAEAGMAASFHITGQAETNPLIRFISHLTIAIVYTAGQLSVAPAAVRMFSAFKEKSYMKAFFHVCGFFTTLIIALGLPVANLALIANGIGETDKLQIFWYYIISNHDEFQAFLQMAGLPENYKPFGSISYVLATSSVLTLIVHPILGLSDSILTITHGGLRSSKLLANPVIKEKELSKDEKKKKTEEVKEAQKDVKDVLEEKKKASDDFMGNIEFLLTRLGYDKGRHATAFNEQLRKVKTVMDGVKEEKTKGVYAEKIAKFRSSYVEMDKNKNTSKEAYHKLDMEVFNMFQMSPKHGGYGVSLKKPVPPKN